MTHTPADIETNGDRKIRTLDEKKAVKNREKITNQWAAVLVYVCVNIQAHYPHTRIAEALRLFLIDIRLIM